MKMVSGFVFILTVVLSVRTVLFIVGEGKRIRILFMCVGNGVHVYTFLSMCALSSLQLLGYQMTDSHPLLAYL
jgi:hypothetical protein